MDKHVTFLASAKELKHSELYMTVKCVMFTAETANLNGVRCTEDFLDSIVAHADEYVCLPLYADVNALESRRFSSLGHRYNEREDKFYTQSIGSFYSFEKENLPSGEVALVGYARILKRNAEVCKAVAELFATNKLFFSFEIAVGSYRTREEDGTMEIYASSDNVLEGMCIVTNPAYPQAEALELCAENKTKEGEQDVSKDQTIVSNVVVTDVTNPVFNLNDYDLTGKEGATLTINAEDITVSDVKIGQLSTDTDVKAEPVAETVAAEVKAEPENEVKAEEIAETDPKEEETAACGKSDDDDEHKKAEDGEDEDEKKEECSEANAKDETLTKLSELASTLEAAISSIKNLGQEVASIKETLAAKQETVIGSAANPFMDTMTLPDRDKKYSLLESETVKPADHYSLLEN